MFWELYQQSRINRTQTEARRATTKAKQSHAYIERLEDRVDTLALACQSLWELLRDNSSLSEADLEAKMEEIDLRDGRKDGKMSTSTNECKNCGRKTGRRRQKCFYCGHTIDDAELFGQR